MYLLPYSKYNMHIKRDKKNEKNNDLISLIFSMFTKKKQCSHNKTNFIIILKHIIDKI